MKISHLFLATLLASNTALAGDPVQLDVFLGGELKEKVLLNGHNSRYRFSLAESPNTTLELRLVAPEPLIVELKETTKGSESKEVTGRAKLIGAGSSYEVNAQESKFHHAYVLVRTN